MWSDAESKVDYLNFSEIAESIADIVCEPELLPISVGVFGNWGAGKSTILNLTKQVIEDRELHQKKKSIHITFDAWLFQGYDDARASILETISDRLLVEVKEDESLSKKIKSFTKRINILRVLGSTADVGATFMGLPTFGAIGYLAGRINTDLDFKNLSDKDKESLKASVGEISQMIKPAESKSPPKEIMAFREEYSNLIEEIGRPIIVYIDNLDRCTPINAIQTLEAIRLFLFMSNTAFVIAADEDMIKAAVKTYHKDSTDRHQIDYLDKLIQVPVYVPKPGVLEIRAYLFMLLVSKELKDKNVTQEIRDKIESSLRQAWKNEPIKINEILELIKDEAKKESIDSKLRDLDNMKDILARSSRVQGNPRIVKRLLNTARMRKKVADRRGMNLDESIILKFVIFERCLKVNEVNYLYQLIDNEAGKPKLIGDLESNDKTSIPEVWKEELTQSFIRDWIKLEPKLKGRDLRDVAYLSKEIVALGVINKLLTEKAQNLMQVLLQMSGRVSQKATDLISNIEAFEYPLVMDELVHKYREISDPHELSDKINGALLLSGVCLESKNRFLIYLNGLENLTPALRKIITTLENK